MRKSDREIEKFEDIIDVLDRCDTIRVGINGGEYPYVVPVSFGYEISDGKINLYFHGAKEGLKHELLAKNSKVCVEADIFHRYVKTGNSTTTEYESVIGFGTAAPADNADAVKGIELLMKHCGQGEFNGAKCIKLGVTAVYKITLESFTGKKRAVPK